MSSFKVHAQQVVQAHIFQPDAQKATYCLCVLQLQLQRGVNTVTTAELKCTYMYSLQLGTEGSNSRDRVIPAHTLEQDALAGKHIVIGVRMSNSERSDGKDLDTRIRPLFIGMISSASIQANTTHSGTQVQFALKCAALIHRLSAQQLGGSWYYAPTIQSTKNAANTKVAVNVATATENQVKLQTDRITSVKMLKIEPDTSKAPIDIVSRIITKLGGTDLHKKSLFQILNEVHKQTLTTIGSVDAQNIPQDAHLQNMLDSKVRVCPAIVTSLQNSKNAQKSWSRFWLQMLVTQLCSCVATSQFMRAIDLLIQDLFRMLQLVPVPLRQQTDVSSVYKRKAPASLMRIIPVSSMLGTAQRLDDNELFSQYAIDSISYAADYRGMLQRPDQIVLYASNAVFGQSTNSATHNLFYFIYPEPKTSTASEGPDTTIRRQQLQAPEWLNWTYLDALYTSANTTAAAVVNPYAQMLYAELYDTYGTLYIGGSVMDFAGDVGLPFDDYIGKLISMPRPAWTYPATPLQIKAGTANAQQYQPVYIGRVQSVSVSYRSSATDDQPSTFRYSATVRVIPGMHRRNIIENKIYKVQSREFTA